MGVATGRLCCRPHEFYWLCPFLDGVFRMCYRIAFCVRKHLCLFFCHAVEVCVAPPVGSLRRALPPRLSQGKTLGSSWLHNAHCVVRRGLTPACAYATLASHRVHGGRPMFNSGQAYFLLYPCANNDNDSVEAQWRQRAARRTMYTPPGSQRGTQTTPPRPSKTAGRDAKKHAVDHASKQPPYIIMTRCR